MANKTKSTAGGPVAIMRGIWFVDHSPLFDRLVSAIAIAGKRPITPAMLMSYPIPVHEFVWEKATYTSLTVHREAGRWFVMDPGVWVEMSSGEHRPVAVGEPSALADIARAVVAAADIAFGD
jgi:hypothetical protein